MSGLSAIFLVCASPPPPKRSSAPQTALHASACGSAKNRIKIHIGNPHSRLCIVQTSHTLSPLDTSCHSPFSSQSLVQIGKVKIFCRGSIIFSLRGTAWTWERASQGDCALSKQPPFAHASSAPSSGTGRLQSAQQCHLRSVMHHHMRLIKTQSRKVTKFLME